MPDNYGIPAGQTDPTYASDPTAYQDSQHKTWLDFGTAAFDAAGNILSVVDSNGNNVPVDQIDQLHTTDNTQTDHTMTYVMIIVAVVILLIFLMIMMKKKG
jgi:hypothetical protein